jgi:hypothetical protein
MREFIASLLVAVLLISVGCSEISEFDPNAPDRTTQTTAPVVPSEPTEPTVDVQATGTAAPVVTAAPSEVQEMRINTELLGDLGLTFEQIRERMGGLTKVTRYQSAMVYAFENNPWHYLWAGNDGSWWEEFENASFVADSGYVINEHTPVPPEDEKCLLIFDVPIREMFIGIELPATVSDIEEKYQITHFESHQGQYASPFYSLFLYNDKFVNIITNNTMNDIISALNAISSCICSEDSLSEAIENQPCECIMNRIADSNTLLPHLTFDEESTVSINHPTAWG